MAKPKSATRRLLRQQLLVMASARLAVEGAASDREGGGGVAGGAAGEGGGGVEGPGGRRLCRLGRRGGAGGAAGEVVAATGDGADGAVGGGVAGAGGSDREGGGGVDGAGGRRRRRRGAGRGRHRQRSGADAGDGAVRVNKGKPVKEKRISKEKMKGEKLGAWVPTLEVENLPPLGTRVDAILKCEKALINVAEINEAILSNVEILSVEATPKFYLSTDCSPEDFLLFMEQLREHNLNVAPFTIRTEINGVEVQVPVTPMEPPNIEDAGYHIIVLRCPGELFEIPILVEDFSGYVKAFSIVLIGGVIQLWHRLGKDDLPSRFSPSSFTDYGEGYGVLTGVYMDNNMLNVMFRFFLGFNDKPKQKRTAKGQRILDTSFIVLGETPRFPLAKEWAVEGLSRDHANRLSLPDWFSGLIHDWKALCLAIFELFIAVLEANLVDAGRPTPDAEKAMVDARVIWSKCQVPHEIVKFFVQEEGVPDEATPICMEALCGRVVTLVRHDYEAGNRALLRLTGYNGYLTLADIQEAYVARKLA